jgi:hypothetical protein
LGDSVLILLHRLHQLWTGCWLQCHRLACHMRLDHLVYDYNQLHDLATLLWRTATQREIQPGYMGWSDQHYRSLLRSSGHCPLTIPISAKSDAGVYELGLPSVWSHRHCGGYQLRYLRQEDLRPTDAEDVSMNANQNRSTNVATEVSDGSVLVFTYTTGSEVSKTERYRTAHSFASSIWILRILPPENRSMCTGTGLSWRWA